MHVLHPGPIVRIALILSHRNDELSNLGGCFCRIPLPLTPVPGATVRRSPNIARMVPPVTWWSAKDADASERPPLPGGLQPRRLSSKPKRPNPLVDPDSLAETLNELAACHSTYLDLVSEAERIGKLRNDHLARAHNMGVSLTELSNRIGLSRERIRQLIGKAQVKDYYW
jgi:hypothetical protein